MRNTFIVDAKTILALGRNSIKDSNTALLELVKNSYDAGANKVEIEVITKEATPYIRVADNGKGMSGSEIENNWLRIGYSIKNSEKLTDRGRRKTGEKGVGRLAADRLGSILTLVTKNQNQSIIGIKVDWEKFNVNNKDLSSVNIDILKSPTISIPVYKNEKTISGTEIIIHSLRATWTDVDIKNLYQELAVLTPPFENVQDFEIYLKTDITNSFNGKIASPFYENAEIELNLEYTGEDNKIVYNLKDKYNETPNTKYATIDWRNLSQKVISPFDIGISTKLKCGPLRLKLLFYPRDISVLQGTKLKLTELREFLDQNAGVKVYRDNIRVKPYGDPWEIKGDWLGIAERKTREPAGIARPTWRVASNQLVGAVFIGRDSNPGLTDNTSREGLIEDNNSFKDLRAIVLSSVNLIELHRHNLFRKGFLEVGKPSPIEDIKSYKKDLQTFKEDLDRIAQKNVNHPQVLNQVEELAESTEKIEKTIEDIYSKNRLLGGLATIGISSAVFGHETQTSIDQFSLSTNVVIKALEKKNPAITVALEEALKAQNYAKKIAGWGNFSLARVQKTKREKSLTDIKQTIERVLNQIQPVLISGNIQLLINLEKIEAETYPMDIETILINLLTNAYTACIQTQRQRKIKITLKKHELGSLEGFQISVADTGPGVDAKLKELIWEALFTTKKSEEGREIGTGLGLAIIQSIIDDLKGARSIKEDPELKGAIFKIWLPIN